MTDKTNSFFLTAPRESDKLRIFCFPYAGGGASIYKNWEKNLPVGVGVYPIQLPGRENRIIEKAYTDMNELTDAIVKAIIPYLDKKFIFFGHSLGAKILYEVTCELRERWRLEPCHIIVSGSRAPHISEPRPLHELSDEMFIKELKRYSGLSEEFLQNEALMKLFLPIFRADFTLDEKYIFKKREKFNFKITSFNGDSDIETDSESVKAWDMYTNVGLDEKVFKGGHFFISTDEESVLHSVSDIAIQYL
ncbi:thioesterase II family protein [Clostridium sp. CTA-5]